NAAISNTTATHSEFLNIAAPISRVDTSVMRLTQVNQTEQQRAVAAAREFREASTQRVKVEGQARTQATPGRTTAGQTQPIRLQLPTASMREGGTRTPS